MAGAHMAAFIGRLGINVVYSKGRQAGALAIPIDSGPTHVTELNDTRWKRVIQKMGL
jgi:hypothetical protein